MRLVAVGALAAASVTGTGLAIATPKSAEVRDGVLQLQPGNGSRGGAGIEIGDGTASVADVLQALPQGGSVYIAVRMRARGSDGYDAQVRVMPDGRMRLSVVKRALGAQTSLVNIPVPGRLPAEGGRVLIEGSVTGAKPVRLTARTWLDGQARPSAAQVDVLDASPAGLGAKGAVEARGYLSSSATAPLNVTFAGLDAVEAGPQAGPTSLPPVKPSASVPTASATTGKVTRTSATPTGGTSSTPPAATSSTPPAATSSTGTKPPTAGTGGLPGPASTGVPAGVRLRDHHGDLTITKAGTVIDGLDVHGFVTVMAPNVVIRNSIVRGGQASNSRGLIRNTSGKGQNLVVENSELVPAHPSVSLDGVHGWDYTLRGVDIHGTVDGAKVFGDRVRIESSWIHDLVQYGSDPYQRGGPSHGDGVQILSGSDIVLTGNTISGGSTSAVMVSQDKGRVQGLVLQGNFLDRGSCALRLQSRPFPTFGPVVVRDNVFGRNVTGRGCAILRTNATVLDAAGNRWVDSSEPAEPKVHG